MISLSNIKRVYLIGIGGIGMSALARYFKEKGAVVSGYDRTSSSLTKQLGDEGMKIHYEDDVRLADTQADLVIYTPAVPQDHAELSYYKTHHFPVFKRSEVLGAITQNMFSIAVAGTHGKTTTSTMIAHILREGNLGCNAFLGGISINYQTNYWSNKNPVAVVEADEYDRSFLQLNPDIAVLTAMDADHLDIYGTKEAMINAYILFTKQIKSNGILFHQYNLPHHDDFGGHRKISYSLKNDQSENYAANIHEFNGGYVFDIHLSSKRLDQVSLTISGLHNVENAVAAACVADQLGIDLIQIKKGIASFKGVKRRFEYIIKEGKHIYIDDYAHHPAELKTLIKSAQSLFSGKKCTLIFQPHLYSRTRDLAAEFAASLDYADEVFLLPIYPAREEPIPGVSSQLIIEKMQNKNVTFLNKEELLQRIKISRPALLITAGAGDIDRLVEPIKNILLK